MTRQKTYIAFSEFYKLKAGYESSIEASENFTRWAEKEEDEIEKKGLRDQAEYYAGKADGYKEALTILGIRV